MILGKPCVKQMVFLQHDQKGSSEKNTSDKSTLNCGK